MSDWIVELKRLGELRDAGVLTEVEFQSEKVRIMSTRGTAASFAEIRSSSSPPPAVVSRPPTFYEDEAEDTQNWDTQATIGPDENETFALSQDFANAGVKPVRNPINRIGSYRILGLLGKGGMGEVFRARHLEEGWAKQQGGDVALKMMRPRFAKDNSFRERFMREAAVGKEVDHPNAARVHEVVLDGDTLGLVMDLVEGKPLGRLIPEDGMLFEDALKILHPLCEALDHLHQKGIIHRDLKPENIRVRPNGQPVILDFGIAKSNQNGDQGMTKTGVLMGTAAYMAPEQIDAKNVGPEADRYALGVMAYEMLCGRRPWNKDTSEGRVYTLKLQGNLVPLHHFKVDIEERISKIVMRMLSVRPDRRFGSCAAFVKALSSDEDFEELAPDEASKKDLLNVRKQFALLTSKIEKLEVKLQSEQTKIAALLRERDASITAAEKNFAEARKSSEKEVKSIGVQIEKALLDIQNEFERKRKHREESIKALKEAVVQSQADLRLVKEEYQSGWSNFVSLFSAAKKRELQDKIKQSESKHNDAKHRLHHAQETLDSDIEALRRKEEEVCSRFHRAGEGKLDIARTRSMKKITQANRQLSDIRNKIMGQYTKTRARHDQQLKNFQQEKDDAEDKLKRMKESYSNEVWIIKTVVHVGTCSFNMIKIAPGKFWMGANNSDEHADRNEKPRHQVQLTRALWFTDVPVTQDLYEEVMGKNPSKFRGAKRPVESLSWYDAIEFCNALSRREGLVPCYEMNGKVVSWNEEADGFRLPTESEWECAAAAGREDRYSGGSAIKDVAWFSANSKHMSKEVAGRKPNAFGLYDLSGNVWEWCWDYYAAYPSMMSVNPKGPAKGTRRVRRGGSWRNKSNRIRVTNRAHSEPATISSACGFRLVRYSA